MLVFFLVLASPGHGSEMQVSIRYFLYVEVCLFDLSF